MTTSVHKRVCSRCVYDTAYVKNITFDEAGVCNYCLQIDAMKSK